MDAPALLLSRWMFFASAMATFGTALFPFYALGQTDGCQLRGTIARLIAGSALMVLLATLAWLSLMTIDIAGDDPQALLATARTILFETSFGPVWLVRLAAACGLLVAAVLELSPLLVLILAAAVLGSEAWLGHSATGGPLQQADILVHLLAAGAWLGGLLPLVLVVFCGTRDKTYGEVACRALRRFSIVGVASVGLIAASGVTSAWSIAGRLPVLTCAYDLAVVAKVGLFLTILAVASFNRFRLLPPLIGATDPHRQGLRLFERTIVVELALGLVVLLAASILGLTDPSL
jgi:putative copper resistance protein D